MLTRSILEQLISQDGAQTVKLDWFLIFFKVSRISYAKSIFHKAGSHVHKIQISFCLDFYFRGPADDRSLCN